MADKTEMAPTGGERSTAKSGARSTATSPTASASLTPPSKPKTSEVKMPEPSPRAGITVNVASVAYAVHTLGRARSVAAIQRALAARGLEPGRTDGLADHGTRAAYARYQRTIGERATGVPTAESLEFLGLDVAG